MGYNIIDQIKTSQLLPSTIRTIEEQVQPGSKVTLQDRNRLFHQLDELSESVQAIQKQANTLKDLPRAEVLKNLEGLQERITGLYGNIDDRFTDTQISEIAEEARTLDEHATPLFIKKNARQVSKEVDRLKRHISTLCGSYRLHREDRKVIAQAKATMNHALMALEGQPYFETIQAVSPIEEMDEDEACLMALDLYEVAELFYARKGKTAITEFNKLPENIKYRFSIHLRRIDPFLTHPLSNATKTAQALCAIANELSLSYEEEGYLTPPQIENLFNPPN